jgi:hypothetical protein
VLDVFLPLVGGASAWDYTCRCLRWFDVFGVRQKLLAAVRTRDAFLKKHIDAERRRLDADGEDCQKKSMIVVLLSMKKTEPTVYTDTMITSMCAVSVLFLSSSSTTSARL